MDNNDNLYRKTKIGFMPPSASNSNKVEITVYIIGWLVHGTNTGNIYDFRIKKKLYDEDFPEISLSTRDKNIESDFIQQLHEVSSKGRKLGVDALPIKAKVMIDTTGIAFEVIQIELLE